MDRPLNELSDSPTPDSCIPNGSIDLYVFSTRESRRPLGRRLYPVSIYFMRIIFFVATTFVV